jgi:hypothetical protein
MSHRVFRKAGKPDRVATNESQVTAAKFEGFQEVKAETEAEVDSGASATEAAKTAETDAVAKTETAKPTPKPTAPKTVGQLPS